MKIVARGWRRDHGAREVAEGDVCKAHPDDDDKGYYMSRTYLRVYRPRPRLGAPAEEAEVRISMAAPPARVTGEERLELNGQYQIQCYLKKSEIAALFHMTHADDSLDEIVAKLASLRPPSES